MHLHPRNFALKRWIVNESILLLRNTNDRSWVVHLNLVGKNFSLLLSVCFHYAYSNPFSTLNNLLGPLFRKRVFSSPSLALFFSFSFSIPFSPTPPALLLFLTFLCELQGQQLYLFLIALFLPWVIWWVLIYFAVLTLSVHKYNFSFMKKIYK